MKVSTQEPNSLLVERPILTCIPIDSSMEPTFPKMGDGIGFNGSSNGLADSGARGGGGGDEKEENRSGVSVDSDPHHNVFPVRGSLWPGIPGFGGVPLSNQNQGVGAREGTAECADANTGSDAENGANAIDRSHSVTVHATAEPIYGALAVQNKEEDELVQKMCRQKMRYVYKTSSRDYVLTRVSGSGSSNNGAAACYHSHCLTESTSRVEKLKLLVKTTASVATMNRDSTNYSKKGSRGFGKLKKGDSAPAPRPADAISFACSIPSAFPKELTFRALAAYTTLRTLSLTLRVSPFTPHAFLRALSLPCECPFLNKIHVQILRNLFAHKDVGRYDVRGDGRSRTRLQIPMVTTKKKEEAIVSEYLARRDNDQHIHGGENLALLNQHTWPLFYMDYFLMFGPGLDDNNDNDERNTKTISAEEELRSGSEGKDAQVANTLKDMDDDVLGIHNLAMDALFRSQPSEISISQCEPPYKDFQWMSSVAALEEDTPAGSMTTSKESSVPIGKSKLKNQNSKRKRRKKNSEDYSSDYDSEYDEAYILQNGSSKRKREKKMSADPALTKPVAPQFCESEKNPRPVSETVYANINDYLDQAGARRSNNASPYSDSSRGNGEDGDKPVESESDKSPKVNKPTKSNPTIKPVGKPDNVRNLQMKLIGLLQQGTSVFNLDAEMKLVVIE